MRLGVDKGGVNAEGNIATVVHPVVKIRLFPITVATAHKY